MMSASTNLKHGEFLASNRSLLFVASVAVGLGMCAGCGPSSPTPEAPVVEPDARFVLLPGCGPYYEPTLHLEGAAWLVRSALGDPSAPKAGDPGGANPSPLSIVPERLRRRTQIVKRWEAETRLSSAVDTPWGTPSADLADRLAAVATAATALAEVIERKDEASIDAARTRLFEKLEDLDALASRAVKKCFSTVGKVPMGRRPSPEEIQMAVRAHFGEFRLCYEGGLRRNPALEGYVTIKFGISRYGLVPWAVVDDTNLPDQQLIECVLPHFTRLTFVAPTRGIVTVNYPIKFSPEDGPTPQVQQ